MDSHILIALVGALLNMFFSVTIPCLVNKSDKPFLNDVKKIFESNRQVILTSSLIVALTIYLALKITPGISSTFSDITGLGYDSSSSGEYGNLPIIISRNSPNQIPPQLSNLIRLMQN